MKTLADLHAHLRSYLGNDTAENKAAAVARAAAAAIRLLPNEADWEFYRGVGSITTSAEYSTGTIAYVESTRTLTLTSGTWPIWAGGGTIEIGGTPYDCASRTSGTVLVLKTTSAIGSDQASGTAYRLYRSIYDLPAGITSVDKMYVATNGSQREVVARHPREFLADRSPANRSGEPEWFGFISDEDGPQVVIWPPSDLSYRLDFLCNRKPTVGRIQQEQTGTASVTGTAVTGQNTAFSSRHVDCVIRLSADATQPTDEAGLNPFAHESLIDSVASATALTLATTAPDALTKVGYQISSRLDVEDGAMWDLVLRLAERSLRQELRMNPTPEDGNILRAIRDTARAVDNRRYSAPGRAGGAMRPWGGKMKTGGYDQS